MTSPIMPLWMLAIFLEAALTAVAVGAEPDVEALLDLRVRRGEATPAPLRTLLDGSPAIVAFWATYCPPCRVEVPILARAARRWAPRGVRVLGIAIDVDGPAELARAVAAWGIDYEAYWLPRAERSAATHLLPAGLPTTFVVGRRGIHRHDRLLSDHDFERTLAEQLDLGELPRPGGG